MKSLAEILAVHQSGFNNIMPFERNKDDYYLFDLTEKNIELSSIDLNDQQEFERFIFHTITINSKRYGIGKYNEDRFIYKRSDVFSGEESRTLHLGIDIWAPTGTEVFVPFVGEVHSFKNNDQHGDYGPTIILEHSLEGKQFYTLYGHLSTHSLEGLTVGKVFQQGELLAWYGDYNENVHWPPHLHFQIIENMGDYSGDYPGVCKPSEKQIYLANCPDPNLILNIEGISDYGPSEK